MPRGGARNRSGPPPDPGSIRSANRDFSAVALPREGYRGKPPACPLPEPSERELEVWAQVWTAPQAAAWAQEPWRWSTVGQYVRTQVRAEAKDAGVAHVTSWIRLGDQIGMTPAGLRENGWVIAKDQVGAAREKPAGPAARRSPSSARDRLAVVPAEGTA